MIKLIVAIVKKIAGAFNVCCEDMAEGIDTNNWKQVLLNIILLILLCAVCAAGVILLVWLSLKFWWLVLGGFLLSWIVQGLIEKSNAETDTGTGRGVTDEEIEFARQRGAEMQEAVMNFMYRVLIAISPFTYVIKPRNQRDIEVNYSDGESFRMIKDIIIYHAETEIEATEDEDIPAQEDYLQQEIQKYALKYIKDYPELTADAVNGRTPVEILGVKSDGKRILIEFLFTSEKAVPIIEGRRKARIERQKRQERTRAFVDEDYDE